MNYSHILLDRSKRLLLILGGFFICNTLVAEFVGVKIFSFEDSLGIPKFNWSLLSETGTLSFSAGTILWPVVFIMTDIINEYYGKKAVRFLSYLTVALILYAFVMVFWAINLAPAEWWQNIFAEKGIDMQESFAVVFGQSNRIIIASMIAFIVGQLLDATIFKKIRDLLGEKMIWLRATASTAISQLVDSFLILYIAFVLGPQQWPHSLFMAVGTVNYIYKMCAAVALIPLLYLVRYAIEKYLGEELAEKLKFDAEHSQ